LIRLAVISFFFPLFFSFALYTSKKSKSKPKKNQKPKTKNQKPKTNLRQEKKRRNKYDHCNHFFGFWVSFQTRYSSYVTEHL